MRPLREVAGLIGGVSELPIDALKLTFVFDPLHSELLLKAEEILRTQEETPPGPSSPGEPELPCQATLGLQRRIRRRARGAHRGELSRDRQRLEKGRLPRPVLTHEDRDGRIEIQLLERRDRGNGKRKLGARADGSVFDRRELGFTAGDAQGSLRVLGAGPPS